MKEHSLLKESFPSLLELDTKEKPKASLENEKAAREVRRAALQFPVPEGPLWPPSRPVASGYAHHVGSVHWNFHQTKILLL